jgi:predicted transcriptional regulator
MSMRVRPAPLRDELLQIMRAAGEPLTTAELAARTSRTAQNIDSQLAKMRLYGYVQKLPRPPPPPRPRGVNRWTLRERR